MIPAALGRQVAFGEEVPCVLPGFEGTLSSVVEPADLLYRPLYTGIERDWFSLAEVYASRYAKRLLTLRGSAANRWWTRLRVEAGLIELDVPTLALPAGLSPVAQHVARGFAALWAVNAYCYPGGAAPTFARSFAAPWCGVSDWDARKGLGELIAHRVIVVQGCELVGGHSTARYRLGALTSAPSTAVLAPIREAVPA